MKVILFAVVLTVASCQMPLRSEAQQQIYRDAHGNIVGTSTQSNSQTIYRDDRGRTTGTATIDSSGNTVFRNERGQITGSRTAPRR